MSETHNEHNELQGLYTKWTVDNKIIERGNYDENLKTGIWYEYNEQSHIHSKYHYSHNRRIGIFESWNDDNQNVNKLF